MVRWDLMDEDAVDVMDRIEVDQVRSGQLKLSGSGPQGKESSS